MRSSLQSRRPLFLFNKPQMSQITQIKKIRVFSQICVFRVPASKATRTPGRVGHTKRAWVGAKQPGINLSTEELQASGRFALTNFQVN